MYITLNNALTALSLALAFVSLIGLGWKLFSFVSRQKEQDAELASLRACHEADVRAVQKEQTLIVYGLLACLKGLKEQGCNGPVTEAIQKIEKHINQKAHS